MAKHVTRWSPDTCGCEIDLEWDDTEPGETRAHTAVQSKGCRAHAAAASHGARATTVLEENTRKNRAVAVVMEHNPNVQPSDILAVYDDNRVLSLVTREPLAPQVKAQVNAALQARGLTKVSIG